jgi:hypothetical protein
MTLAKTRTMAAAKERARELQQQALAALRARFGERVGTYGCKFDETRATLTFNFPLLCPKDAEKDLRLTFETWSVQRHKLRPTDFDLPLSRDGLPLKLVEVDPTRPKYNYIFVTADGRRVKSGPDIFLAARAEAEG